MEALPIRPQTPHRPVHRTPGTGAVRRPSAAAAHPGAAAHPANAHAAAAHAAAAHPAVPVDPAVLAQQREFDQVMILQAEQEREANALRDLAMQQIKRDDQTMNEWIKLI
jgi:hypothetical protein